MESDLELLVKYDMYINGYDPSDPEDIGAYWKEKLNETRDDLH
jgi:hypothetical protein